MAVVAAHPARQADPKVQLLDITVDLLNSMKSTHVFPAQQVISVLCEHLDAAGAVLQRVDWVTGKSDITLHNYPKTWVPRLQQATRTLRHTHPLLAAAAAGDLRPSTAERAAGGRLAWQRSPCRAVLREMLIDPQMVSLGLHGSSKEVVGLAFARSRRDFSTDNLTFLTEVQPLLQALYRHVERVHTWQASVTQQRSQPVVSILSDTGLTGREMEVLLLLARGLTATATARRLSCSPRTVHSHTANIFRKLEVNDRLGAVLEAQQRGLLPHPTPTTSDQTGRTGERQLDSLIGGSGAVAPGAGRIQA